MDEKLLWFIEDIFQFVEDGRMNQFKNYCIEHDKEYTNKEISELEEKLGNWLENAYKGK